MPLSEHEQRVLEQMEQALYAEDPRFASTISQAQLRAARRKAGLGVLIALAGLGLVVLAVATSQIWVGGIGFAAMVLGAYWAFSPAKKADGSGAPAKSSGRGPRSSHPSMHGKQAGRRKGPQTKGGFMDKLEQRWDKRRDQGPGI